MEILTICFLYYFFNYFYDNMYEYQSLIMWTVEILNTKVLNSNVCAVSWQFRIALPCIVTQYSLSLSCTVHETKIRKIIFSVTFYTLFERKQNLLQWLQRQLQRSQVGIIQRTTRTSAHKCPTWCLNCMKCPPTVQMLLRSEKKFRNLIISFVSVLC